MSPGGESPGLPTVEVALGLGTNLGDTIAQLSAAVALLRGTVLTDMRVSQFLRTAPVDCRPGAPAFLNAVAVGRCRRSPHSLLQACHAVEQALGRPTEHGYHEDRTIDVDILLYGNRRVRDRVLTIPHAEMLAREFVLVPLAELAPDWPVPGTSLTVAGALAAWREAGAGKRNGPPGVGGPSSLCSVV